MCIHVHTCTHMRVHTQSKRRTLTRGNSNGQCHAQVLCNSESSGKFVRLLNLPSKAVCLGSNSMTPSALSFFIIMIRTMEIFPISGGWSN